jgi:septin family protein
MREISNMTSIISVITKKSSPSKNEAFEIKTKILEQGKNKFNINFMELDEAIRVKLFFYFYF